MSGRHTIARYAPRFKDQIAELQTHLWSGDLAANRAYFEWKYERNPYLPEPLVHLALAEGRVVAMRGLCGAQWEAGGVPEPLDWPCATDLVVEPGHRNQGLFAKLSRAALDDLAARGREYVLSLSALHETRLLSLATGWRGVGSMAPAGRLRWHAPLARRVRHTLARLPLAWHLAGAQPFGAPAGRAFARLDRIGRRPACGGGVVGVARAPRAEAMAELVARLGHDGRVRHVRDAAFFAWRYANPLQEYRFLFLDGTRLEGYLVLQRYRSDYGNRLRVNLVDWEASAPAVGAALLATAIAGAAPPELAAWTATLPPERAALLQQQGFSPIDGHLTRRGLPGVLIRAVRDATPGSDWRLAGRSLLDLRHWDVRMVDSSLV